MLHNNIITSIFVRAPQRVNNNFQSSCRVRPNIIGSGGLATPNSIGYGRGARPNIIGLAGLQTKAIGSGSVVVPEAIRSGLVADPTILGLAPLSDSLLLCWFRNQCDKKQNSMLLVQVTVDIKGVDETVVKCVFDLVEENEQWAMKVSTL